MEGLKVRECGLLDMDEASSYLGITKGSLYVYVSQGKIGYRKHGNRTYFSEEDLERFLEKNTRIFTPKEA